MHKTTRLLATDWI